MPACSEVRGGLSSARPACYGVLLEALVELVEDAAAVEGQRDGPAGGALGIRLDPVGAELQRPFAVLLPLELGLAVREALRAREAAVARVGLLLGVGHAGVERRPSRPGRCQSRTVADAGSR